MWYYRSEKDPRSNSTPNPNSTPAFTPNRCEHDVMNQSIKPLDSFFSLHPHSIITYVWARNIFVQIAELPRTLYEISCHHDSTLPPFPTVQ